MRSLKISQSVTNRSPILEQYLDEIGKISLLTAEEEVLLAKKIQNGDLSAHEKLVNANLRFTVSVAKKYQHNGLSLEDLIAEANIGLIKAAQRFDPTRGFKFISFAVWWIRQAIMHAINEKNRMIRLPSNQIVGMRKIFQAQEKLEQRLERNATVEELAEFSEMSPEHIVDYLSHSAYTVPLDKEFEMESGKNGVMLDIVEDKNAVQADEGMLDESIKVRLNNVLDTLKDREKLIVKLSFGIGTGNPMDMEEIATLVGLSKERARQIRFGAVKKLNLIAKKEMFY